MAKDIIFVSLVVITIAMINDYLKPKTQTYKATEVPEYGSGPIYGEGGGNGWAAYEQIADTKMKNPPAHPTDYEISLPPPHTQDEIERMASKQGMSLLDYFAGQAMQGYLCNPHRKSLEGDPRFRELLTEEAYGTARAMLEERAKPENQL